MSRPRIHATASSEFFQSFVLRYPDKQYQTWLGRHWTKIGIDYDHDEQLRKKIAVAIVSHFGDMSFSSALKIMNERGGPQDRARIPRFEKIVNAAEALFYSTSHHFLQTARPDNIINEEHSGLIHAELFLLRLLSSFEAARRLINWGFFAEPLAILRSSLEQLSWAYAVGVKFDHKQLESPNPSKCIGSFKECFAAAGQLYGALSRFSHMDFEGQKHFVIRESTGAAVVGQSTEFKFFGLLFYLFLLISYQYVCRDIRLFYSQKSSFELPLSNVVILLRLLIGHALMRPELDRDEIAAILSIIYFETFP